MNLTISYNNSKMGNIPSVSLPSMLTCRKDCECNRICYAQKIERLRPNVRRSYLNNLKLFLDNPDVFWRELEGAIMMSRFFRFHVSGDIPTKNYFLNVVNIAKRQRHCKILLFTKKFNIINDYMQTHNGELPDNIHIIFSGWIGLEMANPFCFPEAHVRFKDGSTTAKENAYECSGSCTECAKTNTGCWSLKNGEQIVFDQH